MEDNAVGARIRDLAVVIPARDEAVQITACLDAVCHSLDRVADVVDVHVVVVDDGSVDGTGPLARQRLSNWSGSATVLTVNSGVIGRTRALGVAHMTGRVAPQTCWVACTDADTMVPSGWASRHLQHAERGVAALAGVVRLIDDADSVDVIRDWSAGYAATLNRDGTHPHVHAANLGFRLDVYTRVGGFRSLGRAEDIDLWSRLRAAGHVPVADSSMTVATSARATGRVAAGFAAAVNRLHRESTRPFPG